jgi:hypothetical protein
MEFEEDLRKQRRKMKNKMRKIMECGDSQAYHKKLSSFISGDNELKTFISLTLRIYGGGFAVIHRKINQIILLQNSIWQKHGETREDLKNLVSIDIPYQFTGHDDFSLIHLLFITKRAGEKIYDKEESNYFSAFFNNFVPYNENNGDKNISQDLLTNNELHLRQKEKIDFLHCRTGEVYFFVIAWRYLLGEIKDHGVDSTFNKKIIDPAISNYSHIYDLFENKDISLESELNILLKKLKNNINNLNSSEEYSLFVKLVLQDWKEVSRFDDLLGFENFLQDWKNIGLLENDRHILKEVINFTINFVGKIKGKCRLLRKLRMIKQKLDQDQLSSKEDLHEVMKESVIILLENHHSKLNNSQNSLHDISFFTLVSRLHQIARFPIMPYFYLSVKDENKVAKEHLAFPLSRSYHYHGGKFEQGYLNNIITCLLTIKPIDIPYSSEDEHGYSKYLDEIDVIRDFFGEFSISLMDVNIYNGLVAPEREKDIEEEEKRFIDDQIGHEIRGLVVFIRLVCKLLENETSSININDSCYKMMYMLRQSALDYIDFLSAPRCNEHNTFPEENSIISKQNLEMIADESVRIGFIQRYHKAVEKKVLCEKYNEIDNIFKKVKFEFHSQMEDSITPLEFDEIEILLMGKRDSIEKSLRVSLSNVCKHIMPATNIEFAVKEANTFNAVVIIFFHKDGFCIINKSSKAQAEGTKCGFTTGTREVIRNILGCKKDNVVEIVPFGKSNNEKIKQHNKTMEFIINQNNISLTDDECFLQTNIIIPGCFR